MTCYKIELLASFLVLPFFFVLPPRSGVKINLNFNPVESYYGNNVDLKILEIFGIKLPRAVFQKCEERVFR